MKKTTTIALASALALGALAAPANAESSNPNPNVPGAVMSSKLSTLPDDIKKNREENREFIKNFLGAEPTATDDFISGSSTVANVFFSDKALILSLAFGVLGTSLAALVGAATTGKDVVKEVLDQAGISPRI